MLPISVIREICMRRLIFLAVGVLFCLGPAVFAQDEGTDDLNRDVFAPFVSRLRVAVRDPQVRITWRDSEDLSDGSYLVYRHTDEINQNTLDAATLVATVEPGVETYLDTPLEEGNYYYAVIAAEADGRTYPIFVPFRNKTLRPVAVTRLESEEDLAASVYDIDARAQDMTVVLVFTPSRSGRTLAVYRSTAPFSELESIGDATLLQEIESSSRRFVDYPAPGVSYYYGVFDTVLIERGSLEVVEGANALPSAVQISLPSQQGIAIQIPRATKRPAPLPILQLISGLQSGERLATPDIPRSATAGLLPPSAERAVRQLLAHTPERPRFAPEPVILPEERAGTGEGVQQTLAGIVNGEFAGGDYARAVDLMRILLMLPIGTELEQRVRFYLGQALYFDGRREPAIMEFVIAADGDLYSSAKPWMDGILTGS
jgi:hypothetical protein